MEPNDDMELSRALREWRVPEAPASLETRVIARRDAVRRRRRSVGVALGSVLAGAAAVLLVVVRPSPLPRAATMAVSEEQPFVPVPNVLPLDSYETGRVLRMDLPVSALLDAGFSLPAADPTAIVKADVLVGDDGRAHAVRLVSDTTFDGTGG